MPELPAAVEHRFVADHGLSASDARQLATSRELVDYYGATVKALNDGDATTRKTIANWVLGEVLAALHKADLDIAGAPVTPAQLATLLARIKDGTVSGKIAKEIFDAMWLGEGGAGADAADRIVAAKGLRQISDAVAIEQIVDAVLASNAAMVAEFKSGKEKAFNALVGQAMKATKGKANPAQVNAILKRKLDA